MGSPVAVSYCSFLHIQRPFFLLLCPVGKAALSRSQWGRRGGQRAGRSPRAEVQTKVQVQVQTKVQAPKSKSKPKSDSALDFKSKSKPKSDSDLDFKSKSKPKSDKKLDFKSKSNSKSNQSPGLQVQVQAVGLQSPSPSRLDFVRFLGGCSPFPRAALCPGASWKQKAGGGQTEREPRALGACAWPPRPGHKDTRQLPLGGHHPTDKCLGPRPSARGLALWLGVNGTASTICCVAVRSNFL